MNPTVWIVRHGKTKLNNVSSDSHDMIRGHLDVPLDKEGIEQAKEIAKEFLNIHIDCIYTSDLQRAEKTAHIINQAVKAEIQVTKNLRPWNLGVYQGKSAKDASSVISEYARFQPDVAVPEGESFNDFLKRYYVGMTDNLFGDALEDEIIMGVCHYRNIKVLEAWLLNNMKMENGLPKLDMDNFLSFQQMDTGVVRKLEYDGSTWKWA